MTLQEWIDRKVTELKAEKKYREAKFIKATPVQLARNSYAHGLFDDTAIPLDSDVKVPAPDDLPSTHKSEEYLPGVMVALFVIKPRCRKHDYEFHKLLLV